MTLSYRQPFVFLDKDGTLIENVPFNVDPDRITLTAGTAYALKCLHREGFRFAVVSNQPGVALGYYSEQALRGVELKIRKLLRNVGIPLAGFYYCPHHPKGIVNEYTSMCICRKPAPGMLLRAKQELGIQGGDVWMIGDILDDVEAGNRAGCHSILLDNGGETEWRITPQRQPEHIAPDLQTAAEIILMHRIGRQLSTT